MILLVSLAACREETPIPPAQPPPTLPPPATLFLVRHAEKESSAADAELTEEGIARAELLAEMLIDVELAAVHSTDTVRTIATATPTALSHGLAIEPYDAPDPLIETISAMRGSHLIVGHSDTLPSLIEELDPSTDIEPILSTEYDRLYVMSWTETSAITSLLHYGAPE